MFPCVQYEWSRVINSQTRWYDGSIGPGVTDVTDVTGATDVTAVTGVTGVTDHRGRGSLTSATGSGILSFSAQMLGEEKSESRKGTPDDKHFLLYLGHVPGRIMDPPLCGCEFNKHFRMTVIDETGTHSDWQVIVTTKKM